MRLYPYFSLYIHFCLGLLMRVAHSFNPNKIISLIFIFVALTEGVFLFQKNILELTRIDNQIDACCLNSIPFGARCVVASAIVVGSMLFMLLLIQPRLIIVTN